MAAESTAALKALRASRSSSRGLPETAVKRAYGPTVDRREAEALETVLSGCESVALEPLVCHTTTEGTAATSATTEPGDGDALSRYDDNRNGRITCKEARAHGIAPVHRGHPAYAYMNDRDGDGVVCE